MKPRKSYKRPHKKTIPYVQSFINESKVKIEVKADKAQYLYSKT